jgi:hypothetical protein
MIKNTFGLETPVGKAREIVGKAREMQYNFQKSVLHTSN